MPVYTHKHTHAHACTHTPSEDSEPTGLKVDSEPTGLKVDSEPTGLKVDSEPTGLKVDTAHNELLLLIRQRKPFFRNLQNISARVNCLVSNQILMSC